MELKTYDILKVPNFSSMMDDEIINWFNKQSAEFKEDVITSVVNEGAESTEQDLIRYLEMNF